MTYDIAYYIISWRYDIACLSTMHWQLFWFPGLHVGAVGCLNNDRSVMSKPFAWRPLGLLPILKPGPCTNNNVAWQLAPGPLPPLHRPRRCRDQWAVFCGQAFSICRRKGEGGAVFLAPAEYGRAWDFLHCHVPTDDCPICECPRDELDRTDTTYELRSGEKIKSMVEAAQAELLNPDGSIKNRCKTKVSISWHI